MEGSEKDGEENRGGEVCGRKNVRDLGDGEGRTDGVRGRMLVGGVSGWVGCSYLSVGARLSWRDFSLWPLLILTSLATHNPYVTHDKEGEGGLVKGWVHLEPTHATHNHTPSVR